jgi:hypothetical protein
MRLMRSKRTGAVLLAGCVLLAAGVAEAQNAGPPINPPARDSFTPSGLVGNPGLSNTNASRVQTVPITATTLILFGAGLLAMPWLRARMAK